MDQQQRTRLLKQIMWDYNITVDDIEAVLSGTKQRAGHYTRNSLFKKMLESYSWYTILDFFSPEEIKDLLTIETINDLRSSTLKKKYEFVKNRLQEIIPYTG